MKIRMFAAALLFGLLFIAAPHIAAQWPVEELPINGYRAFVCAPNSHIEVWIEVWESGNVGSVYCRPGPDATPTPFDSPLPTPTEPASPLPTIMLEPAPTETPTPGDTPTPEPTSCEHDCSPNPPLPTETAAPSNPIAPVCPDFVWSQTTCAT